MKKVMAKLSRRSFFGAAGAAAAAGPLAIEAVAKDIHSLKGLSANNYTLPSAALGASPSGGNGEWRLLRIAELGKQLLSIKRQPVLPHHVGKLDADLVASVSLSYNARLRIQAERDADRLFASSKLWIQREIDELKASS